MVMKVYSPEFKADAVALYLSDPSHTFEGIGKDLRISRETLRNWVRVERARRDQSQRRCVYRRERVASPFSKNVISAWTV